MLLALTLAPFALAAVAPLVCRALPRHTGWFLAILPLASFVWFAAVAGPTVVAGSAVTYAAAWVPSLDVALSFRLDGLSLTFALMISGIGTLIMIYAGGYIAGHRHAGRFMAFLLLFMGSMLGVVIADDLITMFVFWELTSVTSFLLIGFDGRPASRRAALQALIITGGGGLALLAGLLLIGLATGAWTFSAVIAQGGLTEHPWFPAMLALVLLGAFTKSAQVPFHMWLPNAMEAPTPVSAYLHSATMVKAGVYLLARMSPAMGDSQVWVWTLAAVGAATMLTGAVLALKHTDFKLILAATTLMALGKLVMLLGLGNSEALDAFAVFLVAHALYKGALFMSAGAVDHETGTRDVTALGGLRRAMPITAVAAILAALSMGGMPPMVGFISKEFAYGAGLDFPGAPFVATATLMAANVLIVATAFVVVFKIFLGAPKPTPKPAHEAPVSLWFGPALLATAGFAAGFLHGPLADRLLTPLVSAVAGEERHVDLFLWGGFKTALFLSIATLTLGALIGLQSGAVRTTLQRIGARIGWTFDRGYDQALVGLDRLAGAVTPLLQSGRQTRYMRTVFVVLLLVLAGALVFGSVPVVWIAPGWPDLVEAVVVAVTALGALAAMLTRTRLTQVVAVGILGYGVALIFLLFGAPDLAFTQFMVETLVVVIIALALLGLPLSRTAERPRRYAVIDGGIAIGIGLSITLVLLALLQQPLDLSLSEFFAAQSVPGGKGRNIVNVILVDFRALDTLGEIAVVAIAGLAAVALLKYVRQERTR